MKRYPTIETEYAKELFKELRQARSIAKKNIEKKQKDQKKFYDQKSKDVKLTVGDLIMLKSSPRFRLDCSFKGPFQIKSLTSTNAIIQLKDDSKAEELNVSRQRLSLCKAEMSSSTPWVGHSERLRRRRRVRCNRKTKNLEVTNKNNQKKTDATEQDNNVKFSRSGRPIKKPARFLHISNPEDHSQKEGEVVRLQEIDHKSRITCATHAAEGEPGVRRQVGLGCS